MAASARCVCTGTVEEAERRCGQGVPQMRWETVLVIQPVLVERIKGRVADPMMDIPVPPIMEEIMAVVQQEETLVPQGRVQQPTVEHAPVSP